MRLYLPSLAFYRRRKRIQSSIKRTAHASARAEIGSTYANRPERTRALVCLTAITCVAPVMRPTRTSPVNKGTTSDARLVPKEATAVAAAERAAKA